MVRGSHDTHEAPGGAQSRTRKPRPRPWVKRRQPTWVFTQSVGWRAAVTCTVPAHPTLMCQQQRRDSSLSAHHDLPAHGRGPSSSPCGRKEWK